MMDYFKLTSLFKEMRLLEHVSKNPKTTQTIISEENRGGTFDDEFMDLYREGQKSVAHFLERIEKKGLNSFYCMVLEK